MTENKPEIGDDERLFLEAAQSESSQDLMPYYEYCRAEIVQSAREAALLEAARAVCVGCQMCGPAHEAYGDWWHMTTPVRTICNAGAIHDLRKK